MKRPSTIKFFLILCVSNCCFSQDTITLVSGEKISSKVFEIGIDSIRYRKLDAIDTTTLTLDKDEIHSIKYKNGRVDTFNSNANRLVDDSCKCDVITLRTYEAIQAKVIEIGLSEIFYKKVNSLDTSIHTLKKYELSMIKYKNGRRDFFTDVPPENDEQNSVKNTYGDGMKDAEKYYLRKNSGAGATLVISTLNPILGLIPAAICSAVTPKRSNLGIPDNTFFDKNNQYREGYLDKAHQMKKKKIWTNFGAACGLYLGLILIFSLQTL